jgi:mannosyl-oligosaccharide glucosidase
MGGYGWTNYDPRTGGSQTIEDTKGNLRLTTELFKKPDGAAGADWNLRIRGVPITESQNPQTIAVIYVGSETELYANDAILECTNTLNQNRSGETIRVWGYTEDLGSFELLLQSPRSSKPNDQRAPLHKISVASMTIPSTTIWHAKGQ